ncbi:MAG: hypothetical protein KAI70_07365 [Candidatus Omnitrophica bacterium]|nr:hypothetical protein [Candidatus Omnitrophota bacterium]
MTDTVDKREFLRIDHGALLNLKVLKGEKLRMKENTVGRNISACGLLFRINGEDSIPALSSVVWVELDAKMLNICLEIEKDLIVHNGGIFGRVVRIAEGDPGQTYDIGVCFLRRKNMKEEDVQALIRA